MRSHARRCTSRCCGGGCPAEDWAGFGQSTCESVEEGTDRVGDGDSPFGRLGAVGVATITGLSVHPCIAQHIDECANSAQVGVVAAAFGVDDDEKLAGAEGVGALGGLCIDLVGEGSAGQSRRQRFDHE